MNGCRGSGTGPGLAHSGAQKVQNIIFDFWWNFFGADCPGGLDGLFISIQETDTVRADLQMLLKISLNLGAQVIVQIIEHQFGYLFAVRVTQNG